MNPGIPSPNEHSGDHLGDLVDVGALEAFADGAATRVDVGGVAVAVVRIGEVVHAIGDICTHANVSLSDGEVWCDQLELECPKHGSGFSLVTGAPSSLPATQPVAVYRARVSDGRVVVDPQPADTQPADTDQDGEPTL